MKTHQNQHMKMKAHQWRKKMAKIMKYEIKWRKSENEIMAQIESQHLGVAEI